MQRTCSQLYHLLHSRENIPISHIVRQVLIIFFLRQFEVWRDIVSAIEDEMRDWRHDDASQNIQNFVPNDNLHDKNFDQAEENEIFYEIEESENVETENEVSNEASSEVQSNAKENKCRICYANNVCCVLSCFPTHRVCASCLPRLCNSQRLITNCPFCRAPNVDFALFDNVNPLSLILVTLTGFKSVVGSLFCSLCMC
jgi:hypothetical protein